MTGEDRKSNNPPTLEGRKSGNTAMLHKCTWEKSALVKQWKMKYEQPSHYNGEEKIHLFTVSHDCQIFLTSWYCCSWISQLYSQCGLLSLCPDFIAWHLFMTNSICYPILPSCKMFLSACDSIMSLCLCFFLFLHHQQTWRLGKMTFITNIEVCISYRTPLITSRHE